MSVVVLAAFAALVIASRVREAFPGLWPFGTFLVIATLLEGFHTRLRVSARGSVSFVVVFAATLLFNGYWGALIAGTSVLLDSLARRSNPLKATFNVAQASLALLIATAAYQILGGHLPPAYAQLGSTLSSPDVQLDLGLFIVLAGVYFTLNNLAVSTVVSLSSDRSFGEVWNLNFRGVLGYDMIASSLAIVMAWLYVRMESWVGSGPIGIILLVLPLVAIRHVYGLYRQLQESGQELLQLMVKAIEARDPYTSGHSVRVSGLSRAIALELGLPAHQVEQIETAALLHDVGKIHEEFAPLLRKESRLSETETALMQTHAVRSADLVGLISKFRGPIQEAVRHHHERWDGRGYPAGLAGDRIPFGARIILISDTIDAMTTDRPYRKRLALEAVIFELQRCKGTQFDPRVVDLAVSSVAVRRLIAEPPQAPTSDPNARAGSRRLSWPAGRLWKAQRA